jgi:two-component system LytT family response regulator
MIGSMIKCVIIDDEKNNIANLNLLLQEYCPQIFIASVAVNIEEGKKIIEVYSPDLVFLDIQLTHGTGFDLLKQISNINFEVIFVTAYDAFAINAMRFSAVDYLLKPLNVSELQSAVIRAEQRINTKLKNKQLDNLLDVLKNQNLKSGHRIALTTLKEIRLVPTNELIRCESSNTYTIFYLSNNEQIVVSKPMYEYENLLQGYGFFRCHQSHMINKFFIKSWVKDSGGYILMIDGKQVPISRDKKAVLKQFLEF